MPINANKKALTLLLKPANPTPSNAGSPGSYHRDTDRVIKILRYCEVVQRGGPKVYLCAIATQHVTRPGTYGSGRAPYRLFIEGRSRYTGSCTA